MISRVKPQNLYGCWTLFRKEVWRFLKVFVQTVLAPTVSTLLYLLVFGVVFEEAVVVYDGHSYSSFLIPGLVMMALAQNAFANGSSSILQSKMNGNIIFVLLAPLSSFEFYSLCRCCGSQGAGCGGRGFVDGGTAGRCGDLLHNPDSVVCHTVQRGDGGDGSYSRNLVG